jgi:acyl-coenzyme A synthetase/AMP-(fatty) acid ligase/thioesterase domain-containing protein/acyl carrier protein
MSDELCVRQERAMTEDEIAFCERSIPAAFDEAVARDPAALALDGEERATYGELAAAADRIACGLIKRLGGGPEPVGLAFRSLAELTAALFGVLKAGKIAMPIDPSAPRARLDAVLRDSGATLVLGDVRLPIGEVVRLDAFEEASDGALECSASADSPGLLVYTSGSTGEPKGVLTRQGTDLHTALMAAKWQEMGPQSRVAHLYSMSFVAAYSLIFSASVSGATLLRYVVEERGLLELPAWIEQHRITVVPLIASMLRPLAAATGSRVLSSVRLMSLGAESLAASDVALARKMLAPDARLLYACGATEVGTWCFNSLDDSVLVEGSPVPVGVADAGKTIRLEHVEDGVGEIVISSRYLAHGYWRREEETARVFSIDPVSGQRSYRTGDVGRIDDQGRLIIVGRRDRMVKVAGKRVELDAVEHAVLADERVDAAAVVVRRRSNGTNTLVAFVAPNTIEPRAVKDGLRAKLPPYMVPARIVALDALPRLPNGKVDRLALAGRQVSAVAPAADGASAPASLSAAASPATTLERRLVEIWQELLEQPVGIEEDFFELGGDSLLAMELLVEIEERLGHSLTPEALLEAPTIRRLAERISGTPRRAHRSRCSSDHPPIFLVHELGGSGFRYRWLAGELGDEFSLSMLEAPWWDGRMHQISTAEQLAAFHVDQIRRAQPAGPYLLVGYSLGGALALEIAQQLKAAGEEIGLLAVLDTNIGVMRRASVTGDPRTWPMPAPTTTSRRIRRWLWMRWAMQRHYAREIGRWAIHNSNARRIRRRLTLARLRLRWWLDIRLHGAVPERRRASYVRDRVLAACWHYAPLPYDGRVILFRGTRSSDPRWSRRPGPPDLGWGDIARGGLEIHHVDSAHLDLLLEPYVYELASKLGPVIRSSREGTGAEERDHGDTPVYG